MSNKQVRFNLDSAFDYIAEFISDGDVVASKVITSVEADGLEEYVTFDTLPVTLDAQYLYDSLESMCFDNEGEETNFEATLRDLVEEEEN